MVSIATFDPGDPVQIPADLLSQIQIESWVFNTQIIQAYGWVILILITLTVNSLVGGDKWPYETKFGDNLSDRFAHYAQWCISIVNSHQKANLH